MILLLCLIILCHWVNFLMNNLLELKNIENADEDDISETDEIIETEHFETHVRSSSPRYELPVMPEGMLWMER